MPKRCLICKRRKPAPDRGGGLMCHKCHARSQRTIKTIRAAFGFGPLSALLKKGSKGRKNLEEIEAAKKLKWELDHPWDEKRFQKKVQQFIQRRLGRKDKR